MGGALTAIRAGSRGGPVGLGPRASHQEEASHQFAAGALFNLSNCLITDQSAISPEMTVGETGAP